MRPLKITKKDVVNMLSDEFDISRVIIGKIFMMALDVISVALSERQTVEFRGFGIFECKLRASHVGRNPNRPTATITMPKKYAVRFRPSKKLRTSFKRYEEN
jgi:nucleoid DNA-binding protein